MPGVPYPVEPVIIWSLLGAPPGVSINKWEGIITIVGNIVLNVSSDIMVQALWRGETYTALLHLGKVFDGQRGDKGGEGKQGSPAPHYRGKTVSPGGVTGLVTIQINANTTQTVQMSRGDWVAYLGGPIADTIWEPYKCMRWNGASWEQVSSENETSLYMAALMDLTEGAPDGTFTAVFCRVIAAQQAFINELQTKLIHVESAIYGGERYDQNGNVIDDSKDGYWLGSNGRLRAVGGEFDTVDILGNSIFHGDIISGPLVLLSDTPEGNKYTAPAGSSASGIPVPDNNMPILGRYGSIDIIKGRKYEYINTIKVHNSSYKDTDEYTDIYFVTTSGSDMLIARRIIQERWHHEGGFENYWWREVNYIYPITTAYYLEWQYVMSGKTLRLIDLPTKIPEQPGTVYRSGNNLMIK
jgi:hypothetical protein